MLEQRFSDNEPSRRDIPSFIEPRPPLIQNPFMRPRPQKGINLLEQFDEDSETEEPELVQVYLRMKPINIQNNLYEVRSDKCLVTSLDTTTAGHGRRTQHNVSRMYTFSRIFGPDCSQKEIFDQVVKENLKKLPEGHSFTLLTYGASGSGKTYTLMGTVTSPGLVPRALEYVFKVVDAAQIPMYKPSDTGADQLSYGAQDLELQWVKRLRQISAPLRDKYRRMSVQLNSDMTTSNFDLTNRTKYYVWVSFVEIYNEAIYDLLAPPDKRTKLRIREDTSGNVYVKGVRQAFVRSGGEAYDVMAAGRHNLTVAATGVHAHSSRSHCIFTITMLTEQDGEIRTSHIRLCDLAGCERQRAARNTGARMQESRAINTSLHVLERCLHMLRRKQRIKETSLVPYRESKLTRLLGSGLSGSRGEAVSMVVTLNPSPDNSHETKHVLSLASVAQDIQINNTMYASTLETINDSQDTTITSSAEVMKLRSDNERLHFELIQAQARNKELLASMEETQSQNANQIQEYVAEAKAFTTQFYQAEIAALKTEMEELKEDYENLLTKQAAPNDTGSPNKHLQAKVAELMTEIAVLEEQLVEEKLARARAEKEVQHLRTCIEERDEKAFTESSEKEEIVLTDSENESDNEIFNESLEPVFRRDQNKSHMSKNESKINQNESLDDTLNDKSNDTLKDSVKGNDSNDRIKQMVDSKNEQESLDDFSLARDENAESGYNVTINSDYTIKDRSQCEDVFYEATKVQEMNEEKNKAKLSRETYVVKDEPKPTSLSRGTYFVDAPNFNSVKDNDNKKYERPKISETFVNKIIKSLKTTENSNSSLSQFEQLEMAANNYSAIQGDRSNSFGKKLKKRNYFYDNNETIHEFAEKSDKVSKEEKTTEILADTNKLDFGDKPKVILTNTAKLQEQKLYFDEPKVTTDEVLISRSGHTEKRTYFDNIGPEITDKKLNNKDPIVATNKNLHIDFKYDERSPSIVKEEIPKDYKPSTIKKLLGESYNESNTVKKVLKKPDSIDLFESPNLVNIMNKEINKAKDTVEKLPKTSTNAKEVTIEQIRKSIEGLEIKQTKLDFLEPVVEKSDAKILANEPKSPKVKSDVNVTVSAESLDNTQKENNTIDEFENICKDLSNVRATEFDLLVNQIDTPLENNEKQAESTNLQNDILKKDLQNDKPTNDLKLVDKMNDIKIDNKLKNNIIDEKSTDLQINVQPIDDKSTNDQQSNDQHTDDKSTNNQSDDKSKKDLHEETKLYNLRRKGRDKNHEYDEIIAQSHSKCDKTLTKRSLRLRRRQNYEDVDSDKEEKLKDIVNLKQEFSDVTMGLPAVKKEVMDIPSPEKLPGEEENFPPMMGIQSCPSKSVQRSRRKLFTPRAEPLEESLGQTGDSNERLRVPRPSYHRTRARRKL